MNRAAGKTTGRHYRLLPVVVLLLMTSACGLADFTYDLVPRIAVRWVDDYLQLTNKQAEKALEYFRDRHALHARDELPRYYALIVDIEAEVRDGIEPSEIDKVFDEVQWLYRLGVERTIPIAAKILADLDDNQLDALQERLREDVEEDRERIAEDHETRRREEALEDVEEWIGELDEKQRKMIIASIEATEETRPLWLNWRISRNEKLIELLRTRPDQQVLENFLADYWIRQAGMPEELIKGMAANRARYRDMVVALDRSMTTGQRNAAYEKLAEYRESVVGMMPDDIRVAVLDGSITTEQRARQ